MGCLQKEAWRFLQDNGRTGKSSGRSVSDPASGNRSHRRVLESSLLLIERYINDVLRILHGDHLGSISELVNDLDEKRRAIEEKCTGGEMPAIH